MKLIEPDDGGKDVFVLISSLTRAWRYFAKTGACVMSSASVSAAAVLKALAPAKTTKFAKNVMP